MSANLQNLSLVLSGENSSKANYLGPALVSFPDVAPSTSTPFKVYRHLDDRKAPALLIGSNDKLHFTNQVHNAVPEGPSTCRYLLGIPSKESSQLLVFPATFCELRPILKRPRTLDRAPLLDEDQGEGGAANHYASAKNSLGTTFGTKKVRRSIQAAARNQLNLENMGHLQDHLTQSIAVNSVSIPQDASKVDLPDVLRPLPPFNQNASHPSGVYQLHDLIPISELNLIPIHRITSHHQSPQSISTLLPCPESQFVNYRLRCLWANFASVSSSVQDSTGDSATQFSAVGQLRLAAEDARRLRILVYINYLIAIKTLICESYNRRSTLSFPAVQKRLSVPKNDPPLCPAPIVKGILNRYTQSAQQPAGSTTDSVQSKSQHLVTSFTLNKLCSSIAILCLMYDGYACNITGLAEDLQEPASRIQETFKSVGCQLSRLDQALDGQEGQDQQASSSAPTEEGHQKRALSPGALQPKVLPRLARLVVPLRFPLPQKKRGVKH